MGGASQEKERRKPRQRRALALVEAIEVAAAELFARLGYAGTTTNKIAARAGVSIGSLYQYFPNKDAILEALLARHHEAVHQVLGVHLCDLRSPELPLEDGLRAMIHDLVELHRADPDLTKALSPEVLYASGVGRSGHKGHHHGGGLGALLASRPDIREGNLEAMERVISQATGHLTRWLIHDEVGGDLEVLMEEIVQLMVRYLRK